MAILQRRDTMGVDTLANFIKFKEAYIKMKEFYRPAAPSDGFGNIPDSYDLENDQVLLKELFTYIKRFEEQEERGFSIGTADSSLLPATIYTIEAARLLCSVDVARAKKLLGMALNYLGEDPNG